MSSSSRIFAAHLAELSEGPARWWLDCQLEAFPATPLDMEHPDRNVVMRVTYATDEAKSAIDDSGDFPMPLPLDADTFRLASEISLHSTVFGVALYEVHEDGRIETLPSAAYADGNEVFR